MKTYDESGIFNIDTVYFMMKFYNVMCKILLKLLFLLVCVCGGGVSPTLYLLQKLHCKQKRKKRSRKGGRRGGDGGGERNKPPRQKKSNPANVETELRTASYCTICLEYYLKEQLLVRLDASLHFFYASVSGSGMIEMHTLPIVQSNDCGVGSVQCAVPV